MFHNDIRRKEIIRMNDVMYPSIQILEIELINFAHIKSGMNINRLHINFRELDNRITLLVGANGSGKTSTMRCFHPFAYNGGAGDNSDNSDLICADKDGRKTILIGYMNDEYEIVHLYIRKRGTLSVKSYIKKNGVELNDSGSVTTFKNLIENIFDLKETYLSVLSIGNTVSSFVKYTAGERKKFAVKLFSILNIYSMLYKNATARVREIKPVLSNVSAKLDKYRNYDTNDLISECHQLETIVDKMDSSLGDILIRIGEVNGSISTNQSTIDDYYGKKNRISEIFDKITSLKTKLVDGSRDEQSLLAEIEATNNELDVLNINIAATEQNIQMELKFKEDKQSRLNELKNDTERMSKDIDIHELVELKAHLEAELNGLGVDELTRPEQTSNQLIISKIHIDELRSSCIDLITEVDNDDVVKDALAKFLKNHTMADTYIEEYNKKQQELETSQAFQLSRGLIPKRLLQHITVDCETQETCPYAKLYNQIMDVLDKTESDANEVVKSKIESVNKAKMYASAGRVIKKLYKYISAHTEEFLLPQQMFNPCTFILEYLDHRDVCNRGLIQCVISTAEKFETADKLMSQIESVEDKIDSVSNSRALYDGMIHTIESLTNDLNGIEDMLTLYRNNLDCYNDNKSLKLNKKNKLENELSLVKTISDLKLEMTVLKEEVAAMDNNMATIRKMDEELKRLRLEESTLRENIKFKQNRINEINNILTTISSLEREQEQLMVSLNERLAIQQAVSPSDGIPLEFIRNFIKHDLIEMVNDLLDTVYHGKLKLDSEGTIIDDSNFTIPYFWNGNWVPDISRASDGQKAVLTLAFSITLIKMTGGKYNIMLLDEMDTTLDVHSRPKFIELLENYADEIKAWMIFLISHNSMFEGHPVNVLLTSDEVVSNLQNAKIIKLYEGGNCNAVAQD